MEERLIGPSSLEQLAEAVRVYFERVSEGSPVGPMDALRVADCARGVVAQERQRVEKLRWEGAP